MYTDYILSNSSIEEENSLTHHGVKGMKWGRRKQRVSSGVTRSSSKSSTKSAKTQRKMSDASKQKIKKVAKTAAVVAGGAALAVGLAAVGSYAYNNIPSKANTRAQWNSHREMVGLKGWKYIKGSKGRGYVKSTATGYRMLGY